MCLHGLDILSTWVLFFSLLCATASAFQYSHLAKDLDVFVTNCMDNPRSCSAGVDETRVVGNCLYSVCRPCLLVSLVHLSKNSTVVSVSLFLFFFGLHANILGSMCCRAHCCTISLVSRVLLAFSISLCGSLFLEPLFARVGNYLFFRLHGSTRFVSSSLSYVAVSRSREKQLGQAFA